MPRAKSLTPRSPGLGHVHFLINNAVAAGRSNSVPARTLGGGADAQFRAPSPAHGPSSRADDGPEIGPHYQHYGKSEPEGVNGAFWCQGGHALLGQRPVTRGRQVRDHGQLDPAGADHSEQILRNYAPEYRQWQADNEIPMGRYGEPEDIANLVCFLVSPRPAIITGTVIPVDGGLRRYQF